MNGLKKPKTAKEAEQLGERFYFTGKPCKNGHTVDRYTKSRACISCGKKWSAQYYSSPVGKTKARLKAIRRNYGLTEEDVAKLHRTHDGRCAICSQVKKLVIDHDHSTGDVRGLLCDPCNKALGMFCDNIQYLSSAINYLEKNK